MRACVGDEEMVLGKNVRGMQGEPYPAPQLVAPQVPHRVVEKGFIGGLALLGRIRICLRCLCCGER